MNVLLLAGDFPQIRKVQELSLFFLLHVLELLLELLPVAPSRRAVATNFSVNVLPGKSLMVSTTSSGKRSVFTCVAKPTHILPQLQATYLMG